VEGDLQRTLGRNLRAYRTARGISQEDFADVFGFHRTHMGKIERGQENCSLQVVERLAAHIKVDPLDLLSEDFSPS
jgi:transcriptional regulator with XRE-family HTH domain